MAISKSAKLFASAALIVGSTSAFAQPPHLPDLVQGGNRWTITAYDDSSPTHTQWATQGICFYYAGTVGTHQRYIWVSDTYPDWNGSATQEGDQIFMHGDFQWPFGVKDGGHDGMEWQIATVNDRNVGTGHWKEWIEDGRYGITVGFTNARVARVGKCAYTTADEALKAGDVLEFPKNAEGRYLENPLGVFGVIKK